MIDASRAGGVDQDLCAIVYAGQQCIKPKSSARVTHSDKRTRPDDGEGDAYLCPTTPACPSKHSNASGAGKFGQIGGTGRTSEVGATTWRLFVRGGIHRLP